MLETYTDFLDVKEVANELRLSEWGVRDFCRRGVLPSVKIGRRILIPKQQLIAYIEANMTGNVA